MKKHILALFAVAVLAACGTTPATGTSAQSTQQIAAQVCPPVETALTGLQSLVGLPIETMAAINTAIPIVNGVCAAGATVDLASLQTFNQTALPALLSAVKASSMSAEQQNAIVLDITAAKLIIGAFIQAQQAPQSGTTIISPATLNIAPTTINTVLLPATIQATGVPLESLTITATALCDGGCMNSEYSAPAALPAPAAK